MHDHTAEPVVLTTNPGRAEDNGYERYSGFMLGFTLELLRQRFTRPIFRQQRDRLQELIDDLGLHVELPASQMQLVQSHQTLMAALAPQLKMMSHILLDFFTLGRLLLPRIAGYGRGTRAGRRIREEFAAIVDRYEIDRAQIERGMRRRALRQTRSHEFVYELVSNCYEILTIALIGAPKDERACFVIMPFGRPFPSYYARLYRPALRRAGYRPIRAWVGVTDERYLIMVQVLMSLCGAALADVSPVGRSHAPNLNVVHEVGMAQAMIRRVAMIRRDGPVNMPSNFGGILMGVYDPRGSGWPDEQVQDLARLIPLFHTGRQPSNYQWLRARERRNGRMAAPPTARPESRT
jgi:hypothetical protein